VSPPPERRGIPLRAVVPNAVTALALCVGLTGVRFAIAGEWESAILAIVAAAVLDGMDGRIARALNGQSRFGAELDSLSDVIAFGAAPAVILHLWALQAWPRIGWIFAVAYAACMALRLARFNARIDVEDQPHKSAGFLTGVPAPAGAGLLLLPIYLWLASNREWTWLQDYRLVAPWAAFVAFLVISSVATFSWGSLRLRRNVRLEAIVVIVIIGVALVSATFETLSVVAAIYLALIPFSMISYAKVKRQRARQNAAAEPALPLVPPLAPLPPERPARRRRSPPNAP
jgi:CDP-diacylglycerol---serine O-phosphatidyltransferase